MDLKVELEKMHKELGEKVAGLREILDAHQNVKEQKSNEEKLLDRVIQLEALIQRPTQTAIQRRMAWIQSGAKDGFNDEPHGEKVFLSEILKAAIPGINRDALRPEVKTIISTLTDAQGNYLVPIEQANEIIKLQRGQSILRRLSRIWPMKSKTRTVPRQATNVTVTWTGEGVAKTPTKPTYGQLTQTAKKLTAVSKMSDEWLEDESAAGDQFLKEIIADAIALEEDRVGLAGNTGAGDPFMGILYAVGVNVVTMGGATVTGDDIINVLMTMNEAYRQGGTITTSTQGLRTWMKLKDADGNYLWSKPEGATPGRMWNYPYEISDQIPVNLGGGANQTAMMFGNFKKYHFLSDRAGLMFLASKSASDMGTSESAFMQDETWYRWTKRMSIDVALPVAFTRMLFR